MLAEGDTQAGQSETNNQSVEPPLAPAPTPSPAQPVVPAAASSPAPAPSPPQPPVPPQHKPQGTLPSGWVLVGLIVMLVGMTVAAIVAPAPWNWIIVAALMVVFLIVIGLKTAGRVAGVLINERKLMSLSRFQTVLWTIIILSAYFTIAVARIFVKNISDPLNISLDWHLWALMGISITSLVGTPLIQATKKQNAPTDNATQKAANAVNEGKKEEVDMYREGILYGNPDVTDARITDMFEGDEVGNTQFLDLSKVQMFFFTVIAALSYVVILFNMIASTNPANITSFPVLPDGLIAILGISHAGYLTNKAVDHTPIRDDRKE